MEAQDEFDAEIEWFLDHLRVERGASEHTVSAYGNDLRQIAAWLSGVGIHSWSKLDDDALIRLESSFGLPMAPTTAQRRLSALRSFLKFLKRRGSDLGLDLPSTSGYRRPKLLPKSLSKERLVALLNAADAETAKGLRDRALMELIYGAGLRITEAVSLKLSGLDLDELSVRVTGKREKTRVIPLPIVTADWLKRYVQEARPELLHQPSTFLLLSDRGMALRRQVAFRTLRRCARLAGISVTVSPHTLRHTYAVHLIQGGADLRVVQELLGHESIATTQVYTRLNLEEVRRRYEGAHPRK